MARNGRKDTVWSPRSRTAMRIPAAVAGFRAQHTLYAGYMLYVDDLLTLRRG